MITETFFELIQVSIGNRKSLSVSPSDEEWHALFLMAQEQAVLGIAFHALEILSPKEQRPSIPLLYEWIAISESIRKRNLILNNHCEEIQQELCNKGVRSSILKGQGIAKYYDKELSALRQPGDLDVYVDCGRKKAIEIAKELQGEPVDWDYKHLQLRLWDDVEIEIHYRVEIIFDIIKNIRLQKWFKENEILMYEKHCDLITPCVQYNLFYIILHIYRHFLTEGVGLRQVMDYYFVLKVSSETAKLDKCFDDKREIQRVLHLFGINKFAEGVMWILGEVFAMNPNLMICKPSEKEGRFILQQIMNGGNFGHYDSRINHRGGSMSYMTNVIRHSFHIISRYPLETIRKPIWMVWHKCWKLTRW